MLFILEFKSYTKQEKITILLGKDAGRNVTAIRSHSVYDNNTILLILECKS